MAIKVWWNTAGVQDLLTSDKLAKIEREVMENKLSEIQAQFIMDFGFEGSFIIEEHTSSPSPKFGTTRSTFRIIANDARTGAMLKRHQGWLSKLVQ